MAKQKKGNSKVTVYPDWCKGCGICVEFCPSQVFELSEQGKATVVREEECIHCGFCELHCPDFAVVVREKGSGDENGSDAGPDRRGAAGKGA